MEALFSKEETQRIVSEIAGRVNQDYVAGELILIGVLKGCAFFLPDLARQLVMPVRIDFVEVSSYRGTERSGGVTFKKDITTHIAGRDVLIVEDIVDTGHTIAEVKRRLQDRGPHSMRVATFLSKPARREVEVALDYVGREIEDVFVVGYGMDYNGQYRNLPEVRIFSGVEC